MKIASAAIQMAADHSRSETVTRSESLQAWVDTPSVPAKAASPPSPADDTPAPQASSADSAETLPPRLALFKAIVEQLTGRTIRVYQGKTQQPGDAAAAPPPSSTSHHTPAPAGDKPQGWGVRYHAEQQVSEQESTAFRAEGVVKTADGKRIHFQLKLNMSRSESHTQSTDLRAGDALRDPLVINFDGTAAQLGSGTFNFDLNGDGHSQQLPALAGGNAFLALDRNGNGRIDNGNELFGPKTGNGFSELAALDSDGNGWIDSADPAFAQLSLWQPQGDTAQTTPLAQAGIGAIHLGNTATPFTLNDGSGQRLGAVRSSGVYLKEDGSAGAVQQVDLVV